MTCTIRSSAIVRYDESIIHFEKLSVKVIPQIYRLNCLEKNESIKGKHKTKYLFGKTVATAIGRIETEAATSDFTAELIITYGNPPRNSILSLFRLLKTPSGNANSAS